MKQHLTTYLLLFIHSKIVEDKTDKEIILSLAKANLRNDNIANYLKSTYSTITAHRIAHLFHSIGACDMFKVDGLNYFRFEDESVL